VFELKTISDFAESLTDGRLFRQAGALARSGCPCALILERAYSRRRPGICWACRA
jgi:ERCC4-type nuclease